MDKATPDSVMALATDLWHADGGEPFRIKRNELRAEVERLAAQSAPTEPVVTKDQRELIAKLRYMGKQYAAGQFARGGVPQKHYLEEAADEIEMMAWALNMNEKTPGSAQENADLRNVIQAACIDGIPGLERAWAKYFPGKPITVSPGAVAQSAPTEEMSPEFTDTARAALLWVLWHHQGASSKVGQPIRFALGMDQYQPLSEYQVREAKRWAALNPTRDAANVPPGEWQNEGEGLTPKQAWWAGYRVGKGLPPDMPRSEAVAQSAPLAQQASGQQTQRVHQLLGSWNEAYPRMDIHSQPGTVVMFDGRGGYEIEQKSALKMLTLRGLYTVDHVDIGGTSSTVYLTGFTRGFNTCLFAQAPVDADRAAAQVEPRGTDAQILFERKLTCEAVQGAMAFGYQGKNPPPTDADHWLQPFWDIGNRTRQLEQAATLADFHRIMAMPEAEVDAELRSLGIDPDKAAERADRAIKGALAGAQVEPVRMLTEEEPEKCYSLDEENFHDFGDFMDMLDEDQCKPGFLVFEGDSVRHTASHYARGAVANLLEQMGEQAFDDAGEHIGDWPDNTVKDAQLAELEKLIFDWLDANVKVHFYTVKNVREIALTAEMIGDDVGVIPADGEVRNG